MATPIPLKLSDWGTQATDTDIESWLFRLKLEGHTEFAELVEWLVANGGSVCIRRKHNEIQVACDRACKVCEGAITKSYDDLTIHSPLILLNWRRACSVNENGVITTRLMKNWWNHYKQEHL